MFVITNGKSRITVLTNEMVLCLALYVQNAELSENTSWDVKKQ